MTHDIKELFALPESAPVALIERSEEDMERERERFMAKVRPQLEKNRLARQRSEERARTFWLG